MSKKALYLAGGGARGAYQAGVLKAMSDILKSKTLPFSLISGVSIGSINAAVIAQHADDFPSGVDKLITLWEEIACEKIFNTSNYQLGKSVFRNLSHFFVKQRHTGFLLDTQPLHTFIQENITFDKIRANIEAQLIDNMEVISNCYESQQTVSFYQSKAKSFDDWRYPRHISQQVDLCMSHLLASSALPLFFPAVKINGFHYGDGSMGLVSPLRGAIRFNVNKILIIGTRQLPVFTKPSPLPNEEIGFAHILGNMLNGLFLDNLDRDIEMVNRMNDISQLLSMWKKRHSPWRPIETLHLRPSADVAHLAQNAYQSMPSLLRFMLNLLGAQSESGDLLSFLLFEADFTKPLIELGYQDTMQSEAQIKAFFES